MPTASDDAVTCSCHSPSPPSGEYAHTTESLDILLDAETQARLQRRIQQESSTEIVEELFPYCSVFAPPGMFPIQTAPVPLFMDDDNLVSDIRASLLKERHDAAVAEAAMEEAELAALELKCMLLESTP
ncbi:hypothetical protein TraAM80_04432 [Trypanosoma rangeli]|uniref:Uncharacterized protein n=1 Tax=Trypanosoma rangeli TaxID=5698 RepID=A0A422NJK7_TRYRA|nr:uncharacterized protein TraAM80_04432 [Trypanosoma rangeli]RNF05604.1 hypothetical protein TraAM80_04432 [Trypanosoma rangeli]|eukprot:RNF05604.1 hypothetical protein TraAM80_04432 [Trypanosoma rangeli]